MKVEELLFIGTSAELDSLVQEKREEGMRIKVKRLKRLATNVENFGEGQRQYKLKMGYRG